MKLYRDFTSQEEIDREYNVEAMVPDLRPYLELFVGGSEKARRELPCVLDVRVGPQQFPVAAKSL
jgi:arylformamidase